MRKLGLKRLSNHHQDIRLRDDKIFIVVKHDFVAVFLNKYG